MKLAAAMDLANRHRDQLQQETANIGEGMAVAAHLLMTFCADAERAGCGSRDQNALLAVEVAIREWREHTPTFSKKH